MCLAGGLWLLGQQPPGGAIADGSLELLYVGR
jgi:hypothetical protein